MLGCFSGQRRVVTDESCTNGTRGSVNFTASGPEPVSQSECVFMPVLCVTKHCQFVSVLMAEQEISRGRHAGVCHTPRAQTLDPFQRGCND